MKVNELNEALILSELSYADSVEEVREGDLMMEATDYEYDGVRGKAHVGITRSGEYLTKRHKKLLATLLQLSDKRKLDITLIGHSLGAGAATIAAMNMMNSNEFAKDIGNDVDYDVKVSANVIGFGCPALLSRNLSQMTRDFVTTVIADADVIPRSESIEALLV
jgi:hypothetical protein